MSDTSTTFANHLGRGGTMTGAEAAQFDRSLLRALSRTSDFTLWHYKAQTVAETRVPGFFDAAFGELLYIGDLIIVSGTYGAQIMCVLDRGNGCEVVPCG